MLYRKHVLPLVVFTAVVCAAGFGGETSRATSQIPDDVVSVDDAWRPALGGTDAPVVMVVFTDYQCPYCKKFFEERLPALRQRFVDSGELRVVVRDMPLVRHRFARPAAAAAACAERQDAFWPMHEALYARQAVLADVDLQDLAETLGLEGAAFERCMEDDAVSVRIDQDLAAARRAKISGTPGFLIGVKRGGAIYGSVVIGDQPPEVFQALVNEYLDAGAP